jgi:hypothetical protein
VERPPDDSSPFCRAGQGGRPRTPPRRQRRVHTNCGLARSDALDQSVATVTRQAGLLAHGSRWPRTAFPHSAPGELPAVALVSGAWPFTAAAPRRICTGFPLLTPASRAGRRTCRDGNTLRAGPGGATALSGVRRGAGRLARRAKAAAGDGVGRASAHRALGRCASPIPARASSAEPGLFR